MNTTASGTSHVDVLIVGAGLSGIGAAYRLQQQCPEKSFAIVEARDAIGGTWDLFRYPGVRSDSDMFTLSYPFRPWRESNPLGSGENIRGYIQATATEAGIVERIRFRTKVVSASWSSADAVWAVECRVGPDATPTVYTCSFLYTCSGYYDYDNGNQPVFEGRDDFAGTFVHPQFWPENLDYTGKRVVVIGSGATAVTLVPAMAGRAAHVTMLQRSPTYLAPLVTDGRFDNVLRAALPAALSHRVLRAKYLLMTQALYQFCRRWPNLAKRALRRRLADYLPEPAVLDRHFTPNYAPWDQRLCVIPDGDLLRVVDSGQASVVTDRIDRFVPEGIRLVSGAVIEADIVVSATGLILKPAGGVALVVDGERVDVGQRVLYHGVLLSGVPNYGNCYGYINASWTLRADLSSKLVCRFLNHLDANGYTYGVPAGPPDAELTPLMNLASTYLTKSARLFPQTGQRGPWAYSSFYPVDRLRTSRADFSAGMRFGSPDEALEDVS